MTKAGITIAAALLALAISAPCAGAEMAPDALARSVTDEVLAIVRADKALQAGDSQKVAELVDAKLAPHFDFMRMTQLAVGRHWREATPEQRTRLTGAFKVLLVHTYATAFAQYHKHSVDYRPVRMEPGATDVVVKSLIRQPSGQQPIAIDYSMEKLAGTWKVYDVKIEGISLVENYRNTFNNEISRTGVDGLIRALNDKNKLLAAQQQAARRN